MIVLSIVVAFACVACSAQSQPTSAPGGPPPSSPVGSSVGSSPAPPPAPPPPAPAAAGTCNADARHCCKRDGTIATPGGCQPDYPSGVMPATTRGADGSCTAIECHLRCLPATAQISTPAGDVNVSRLRVGDVVWSADAHGARIAAPLIAVTSVPVVGEHSILAIELADGRTAHASAGHPLVDGRLAGAIRIGSRIDGAVVTAVRRVPYRGATWDLLPAGPTGTYWADGVRVGSTLSRVNH